MAMQPVTVGEMQAFAGEQERAMRAYIDSTFLTIARADSQIEQHLRDMRYVTLAELRGAGFAPASEVKEDLTAIVQRENQTAVEVREQMQQLFAQSPAQQAGFEHQVSAANATSKPSRPR